MKKLFLIPLMTLMTCVMAWGYSTHTAGTIFELQQALSGAANGDVIKLTADLTYTNEACINITRSVTIDGQGHKISGGGIRTGSTKSTLAINQGAPDNENWIDLVTLKNLTLQNAISSGQALNVRCNLTKLVIENCTIKTTGSGNNQPITFGGNQETPVDVTINDSYISSGQAGYPLITFNPIALTTKNTTYKGYCSLYFKGPNGSAGTGGSIVNADNCDFDAPNMNPPAGGWNSFGTFAIEDGGITFNLNNCGFNSQEIGSDQQQVFFFSSAVSQISSLDPCVVHITGDNSHINGHMLRDAQSSIRAWLKENYDPNSWDHVIEIAGGTYAEDPSQVTSGDLAITIAEGYEVSEVNQGGVTLYRIIKETQEKQPGVMYDLNDLVVGEGEAEGNNPVSSFDLSTGTTMELNQGTTTAGYVQVSDNITYNTETGKNDTTATTIQVGKTEVNEQTQEEEKVDQTLVINNGLDVQGDSKVEVQAGSALIIGEGGINTEKPENIVIEANEDGAASLLLEPSITVNQTPELTVKMTATTGVDAWGGRVWHRFALPVDQLASAWEKTRADGTYLYGWDYNIHNWAEVTGGSTGMTQWHGYTLSEWSNAAGLFEVTYTFKGHLAGNMDAALELTSGYNFFGNSYTGYISAANMLSGIADGNVDGSVWMWDAENQTYGAASLSDLINHPERLEAWQTEVAPMQTFILRLATGNSGSASIDYSDAIWGNPRYGNTSTPAPKRRLEHVGGTNVDDAYMRIVVTAENGKSDYVTFTENSSLSDEFDNNFDAMKFMNENHFNFYATVSGAEYTSVATNSLVGKKMSLRTLNDVNYTMSFKFVEGTRYAVKDNVTGQITDIEVGNTYTFTAQPNAIIDGRFEIVERYMVPTGIDSVEDNSNIKGIYTLLGQYVGEDFNALPNGIYIVNGVKVVK